MNFAEDDVKAGNTSAANAVQHVADKIKSDEYRKDLDPEAIKRLESRLAELQKKAGAGVKTEATSRAEQRIKSDIESVEDSINSDPYRARDDLDKIEKRLTSDETKAALDDETRAALSEKVAATRKKLDASLKTKAMAGAEKQTTKIEKWMDEDPYKKVQRGMEYKVGSELSHMKADLDRWLKDIPADDADRKGFEARFAAVQAKVNAAGGSRDTASSEDDLVRSWTFYMKKAEGWREEGARASRGGANGSYGVPVLTKTVSAVRAANLWLADRKVVAARDKLKDSAKFTATVAEAEKTRDEALEKLDKAFNDWMDTNEKKPRPQGATRTSIDSATKMARAANDWFNGTKYKEPNVDRALALDKKWKAELDDLKEQHQAALKKMTEEATANWPKIDSASGAVDDFNPGDADAAKGKTYRFKAIRNRSGWDFDGAFDLVMTVNGQPVAGNFEQKIKQAFADAKKQTGEEVDDHKDWDVIAVIQGPGTVNAHYSTEIKGSDQSSLGKVEGYRPVPCTLVKIIAVRAGPVAVSAN